jgi:hypothetical protein
MLNAELQEGFAGTLRSSQSLRIPHSAVRIPHSSFHIHLLGASAATRACNVT